MPTPRRYSTDAERQRAYRARKAAALRDAMEAKGIPAPPTLATMPGYPRWRALLETARAALEATRDEMTAYHEERSEAWQEGDRGATMQEQIDALDTLISDLEALDLR